MSILFTYVYFFIFFISLFQYCNHFSIKPLLYEFYLCAYFELNLNFWIGYRLFVQVNFHLEYDEIYFYFIIFFFLIIVFSFDQLAVFVPILSISVLLYKYRPNLICYKFISYDAFAILPIDSVIIYVRADVSKVILYLKFR